MLPPYLIVKLCKDNAYILIGKYNKHKMLFMTITFLLYIVFRLPCFFEQCDEFLTFLRIFKTSVIERNKQILRIPNY